MKAVNSSINPKQWLQLVVILPVFIAAFLGMSYFAATPALANTTIICDALPDSADPDSESLRDECLAGEAGITNFITAVVNVLLLIVGIAAVFMLIVAGLMYTLSGGDPDRIKTAKNMIVYSLVGVVIAFGGRAIIAFVLSNV